MHGKSVKYIFALIIGFAFFSLRCEAQFKEKAFSQTYNDTTKTASADSTDKFFSFKDWAGGLAHKNTIKIGTMFAGSMFAPGTAQIYNKDYWKLPVIYSGIGALAGTGGYYLHKYNKTRKLYDGFLKDKSAFETQYPNMEYPFTAPALDYRSKKTGTWLMVGAGVMYWASLLDGVICYESDEKPLPGRATLYSALVPGLGQIYNGELYKVPIYWTGLLASVHFLSTNNTNYVRFKRIHNEAAAGLDTQGISEETAKWYRDVYRRYRDYSIVATVLVYFLQVIDANVFAYMHDFEVNDDISMNMEPTVIAPDNAYALHSPMQYGTGQTAVGMKIGFRF